MILTLDVGNSQIHGGVFSGDTLQFQFRRTSRGAFSSDELGVFLRAVLRENGINPESIARISACTVVPEAIHSLRNACRKYFRMTPFLLQPGVKTGLKIRYRNPLEVGADRIANAVAVTKMFTGKNVLVIDLGTATTFCAITASRDYLGGMILPGLRISMEALSTKTAKLPPVEIVKPQDFFGRSTIESIQSGLFYGTLASLETLSARIKKEVLKDENALVIGTGGFSRLFADSGVFHRLVPELVLNGLRYAEEMNRQEIEPLAPEALNDL